MGFYLFAVGQLVEVLAGCEDAFRNDANFRSAWLEAWMFFWTSASSTVVRWIDLATRPRAHLRLFTEALKVSGSMIASVRFFIFMSTQTAYLSGPSVIAFCAGDTFGDSVHGAFQRLTGVLFGSVLGYFADSYANTPVEKVASLCTIVFVCNLLRDGKRYGGAAFFAGFNVISMISLMGAAKTATYLTTRIQQNTFAVLILCAVSLLIWPPKPQQQLREKRSKTLRALDETFSCVLRMFGVPLSDDASVKSKLQELQAKFKIASAEVDREALLLSPAEEEPFCAALLFPAPLNRDIYTAERRLLFTLDVLVGAWTLIAKDAAKRLRPAVEAFLLALAPTAEDVAGASLATTNILREMVLDPFSSHTDALLHDGTYFVNSASVLQNRLASGYRAMCLRSQSLHAHGKAVRDDHPGRDLHVLDLGLSPLDTALLHVKPQRNNFSGNPLYSAESISVASALVPRPASVGGNNGLLMRDKRFMAFMRSISVSGFAPAHAVDHEPATIERDDLGFLAARSEDIWGIQSLRHGLMSYMVQVRTLAVCVDDMHHFDHVTNVNPERIPVLRGVASMTKKFA